MEGDPSKRELIEHALRKWRGLTDENLKKHGMQAFPDKHIIRDKLGRGLYVDRMTCSLCFRYMEEVGADVSCEKCLLYEVLGTDCCDYRVGPYEIWADGGGAEPMIEALEMALEMVKEEEENTSMNKK